MSNHNNKIIGSFLKFSLGPWLSAIISFIATPVVTWLILPAEAGKASLFSVAFAFLMGIAGMGTDQSFLRMFHEKRGSAKHTLMFQSVMLPLLVSVLFSCFMLFFRRDISRLLFDTQDETAAVVLLCFTLVFGVLERYSSLLLRIQDKGMQFSIIKLAGAVVNTSSVVLIALLAFKNFYAVIIAMFLSLCASCVTAIVLERQFWKEVLASRDLNGMKMVAAFGFPYVPTFLLDSLFQSFDRIFLRKFSTLEQIGVYSTAFKLVSALTLIQIGFATFWAPLAYERYQNDPDCRAFYAKVFALISYVMFSLGLVLMLLKDVIVMVFSWKYRDAANVVPLLVMMPLLYTASEVSVLGINICKKTRLHFWVMICSLLTCVVANFAFVPRFGIKGAAGAIAASYIAFFYSRTFLSQRVFPIDFDLKRFSFSLAIVVFSACVNTVAISSVGQVIMTAVSLVVLTLLYKGEFKLVLRELSRYMGRLGSVQRVAG